MPVPQRSADIPGTVDRTNTAYAERPWRMVAGILTANQYHCAVGGDAPDPNGGLPDIPYVRVWADGDWQGTENRNRKLLEKHLARAADKAPAPVAPALVIDAKRVAALVANIPDDLSIPPFLDTSPLAVAEGSMRRPHRYRLRLTVCIIRRILTVLDAGRRFEEFEECTRLQGSSRAGSAGPVT